MPAVSDDANTGDRFAREVAWIRLRHQLDQEDLAHLRALRDRGLLWPSAGETLSQSAATNEPSSFKPSPTAARGPRLTWKEVHRSLGAAAHKDTCEALRRAVSRAASDSPLAPLKHDRRVSTVRRVLGELGG